MDNAPNNLILIGMPGAGKSTIGVILAKRLGFHFIDTDLVIQAQEKCRLQEIINRRGLDAFREIEEQILLGLDTERCVIATGGSVIYSRKGLEAIGRTGLLIYLQVPLRELAQRIADMGQRGLVIGKDQSFAQLYAERTPLYEKFADLTIPCEKQNAEQVASRIECEVGRSFQFEPM
ncbi:MAG: shikimate kinase [Desulfuromonadales bacterium]|nr:shikimate kinase [Desulfuromonadales bacterium]